MKTAGKATDGEAAAHGPASRDVATSMRFEPAEGIANLDKHLDSLAASAAERGFACSRHDLRNALQAATFRLQRPCEVTLRLSAAGSVAVEARVSNRSAQGLESSENKEFSP